MDMRKLLGRILRHVLAGAGGARDGDAGGRRAGVGVGWIGVAFAAGLAVLTMAYAVGGISGGHFNPAVTLGLAIAGRFDWKDLIGYWIAQIVGGAVAAASSSISSPRAPPAFTPAGSAPTASERCRPAAIRCSRR